MGPSSPQADAALHAIACHIHAAVPCITQAMASSTELPAHLATRGAGAAWAPASAAPPSWASGARPGAGMCQARLRSSLLLQEACSLPLLQLPVQARPCRLVRQLPALVSPLQVPGRQLAAGCFVWQPLQLPAQAAACWLPGAVAALVLALLLLLALLLALLLLLRLRCSEKAGRLWTCAHVLQCSQAAWMCSADA